NNGNARQQSFNITREARKKIHAKLCDYVNKQTAKERAKLAKGLGLDLAGDSLRFEVHTVSVADRQGPDGRTIRQFVITLVQKRIESDVELWSGATILMDRSDHSLRYAIRKGALSERRLQENVAFAVSQIASDNPYFRVPLVLGGTA